MITFMWCAVMIVALVNGLLAHGFTAYAFYWPALSALILAAWSINR